MNTLIRATMCLLVINTLSDQIGSDHLLPTQFPLDYVQGLEPSLLRLFQTPTSTLQLFLTDSPILKHSSVQRKLELQVSRFVLDLSDLAKVSHNLKRSVSFLKNSKIKVSSEFKSTHSGALEFKIFKHLSFHQCRTHCTSEKSLMFNDLGHLTELFKVMPYLAEKHPDFWLMTSQIDKADGAYGADYQVFTSLHDEQIGLLPKSQNVKTTQCFAFRDGKRLLIPCDKIGTKLTYFSNLSGQYSWWSRQHVKLLAMVHLASAIQAGQVLEDKNAYQSNQAQFQLENLNISLQVAVSRAISLTSFQFSDCVCERGVSFKQHGNDLEARNRIDHLYYINQQIQTDIELERIRGQSVGDLSSVQHLLSEGTESSYNDYVKYGDILPLSTLQATPEFQLTTDNSTLWNRFVTAVNLGDQLRSNPPKATLTLAGDAPVTARLSPPQPLVAAGIATVIAKKIAIQAVAVGVPYLAEHSNEILSKILAQTNAKIFKSRSSLKARTDKQLNIFLKDQFKNINMQFSPERVKMSFADNQNFTLTNNQPIGDEVLRKFLSTSQKLAYFESHILPKLAETLLHHLLPRIQHLIKPNSNILLQTIRRKSFSIIKVFWERPMVGNTITKHAFLSLPSIQASSSLYTHFVKNLTVSQGESIKFSPTSDQNLECQKQFLGDKAVEIATVCPLKEIKMAAVEQSLRWGKGQIFFIHSRKEAVIHLTCSYSVTRSIKLGMDFSLFLIHDACAVTVIYGTKGSRYSRPSMETSEALSFTFFHILQYNLVTSQTKSDQIDLWRYMVSGVITLLVVLLIVVLGASYYCIKKYRLEINFPPDHENYHSRQTSPNPDPVSREHSAEAENMETRFQGGREKVFTTSLMTALTKIPARDETYGFITKATHIPQGQKVEFTCHAPILRRPSAPMLNDGNPFSNNLNQPYCLRNHDEPFCLHDVMSNDKYATIRRAK